MGYVDLAHMHEDKNTKVPYMMEGDEKVYFRSNDIMFSNSRCLFIEYTDIIKSPWIVLLLTMSRIPDQFSNYFNMDRIVGLDSEGLSEWYIHRNNQNPLVDLVKKEFRDKLSFKNLNDIANNLIESHPEVIELSPILNVGRMLKSLPYGQNSIVKKVVIWYPYHNEVIENDLYDTISDDISFVSGKLTTVLKDIPNDSTYIFSDVTNLPVLYDENKLTYSSVVVADEYWYNLSDGELKVDIDAYKDACDFIFSTIYASVIHK